MSTPSRTNARVAPLTVAVGSMIETSAAPTPTPVRHGPAVIVELARTLTAPDPTFTSGMLLPATWDTGAPMNASTAPVISPRPRRRRR